MEYNLPPPFYRKPLGLPIEKVFTPRSGEVNKEMYINRYDLEKELIRALDGSMHIIVYGESGGGKTWLCKNVLSEIGAFQVVANMANASRLGSINNELANVCLEYEYKRLESYSELKNAEANAIFAKASIQHTKKIIIEHKEPLECCFKTLRDKAKDKKAVLVFDNLERIFDNPNLMKELGDIITVLDDSRYSRYDITLLIIGVPAGIKEYFSKTNNLLTVANRIEEISEVSRLNKSQVYTLLRHGFINLMKADIPTNVLEYWANHTYSITLGIPQKVQEYCLRLAYAHKDNTWVATKELTKTADEKWLEKGLAEAFTAISAIIPKNKSLLLNILYCLSRIEEHAFDLETIEMKMAKEFPNLTKSKRIQYKRYANKLINNSNSILREDKNFSIYSFCDPRYLMCLRLMLKKDEMCETIYIENIYRKKFGYSIEKQWGREN